MQVVIAVDGQQAIDLAASEKPDLILMDMSLPVLDGWEATRRLKADAQTKQIPIIALTAHAMPEDERKAREAGCDDYDTKPVELPRLLEKIEALLGSAGQSMSRSGKAKPAKQPASRRSANAARQSPRSPVVVLPRKLDLSKIRHDLRTPINHILGYCEMLQEDEQLPAMFAPDLAKIHAGGRQLLALIAEYFDEETFETKRGDVQRLCHDLRTPVNQIIGYSEMLQEQAEEIGRKKYLPDLRKIRDAAAAWLGLMEEHLLPTGSDADAGSATRRPNWPAPGSCRRESRFNLPPRASPRTPVRSTAGCWWWTMTNPTAIC